MKQKTNQKSWAVPLIFFGSLGLIGFIVGGVIWLLLNSPDFFTCFAISFALSVPAYFCWGTMNMLLEQDSKKKIFGILGIVGRYVCAVLAIALCYVFLKFTSQQYLYLMVAPTVIFITYLFVILLTMKRGKEEV